MNSITYIGLDVHTTNYTICAYNIENDKTFAETTINPDIRELDKYLKKIQELQGGCKLVCGYEAGSLGYSLYQQLTAKGYECIILAPTTMPKTAKEIKTDKRDARKIAKCLAFGTYSKVFVPDDDDVAVKEYIRMRDDAKIMRCLKCAAVFLSKLSDINADIYFTLPSPAKLDIISMMYETEHEVDLRLSGISKFELIYLIGLPSTK